MPDRTTYDDALPKFAAIVARVLGDKAPIENFFLRDSSGRLTFVHTEHLDRTDRNKIVREARELEPYVERGSASVASISELFDVGNADTEPGLFEYIQHPVYEGFARVVERRIVGQDWLERPRNSIPGTPPIVVFGSHKGGVGRSTALAVAANSLAQNNYNVLVLDMDLEAPGLAGSLLPQGDNAKFGSLDYFVESVLAPVDDSFLEQMVAVSGLTKGRGRVHVCPAVGSIGETNAQNVLGKIARAYLESEDERGNSLSFLEKTRSLVARLTQANRYDAVFVDARAGLNEATAAAFLGLGADVLLFGVNTPQTFTGYRYFLSYLQRFRPESSGEDDWRFRLRMVHAKASPDPKNQQNFRTQSFELFADSIYDEEEGVDEASFNFDYDDATGPHYAWPILYDSNYSEFNPIAQPEQFSRSMYERTFGPFIDALMDRLNLSRSK
ncbi:ParA family protein [Bradyrhizobium algeriense]